MSYLIIPGLLTWRGDEKNFLFWTLGPSSSLCLNAQKTLIYSYWVKIFFKIFFIDYAVTVFPIFPPLSPLLPDPPTLQHCPPHVSSCPWVVHISSLSPLFPVPFLPLPYYLMPTNHAASSLYLTSLFLPSPSPLTSLCVMSISLILFLFWLFA